MQKLWTGADFWVQASLTMSDIWSRSQQKEPHFIYLGKWTSKYSAPQEVPESTWASNSGLGQRRSPAILEQFSDSGIYQHHQQGLWKQCCQTLPPEHLSQEVWDGGREFAVLTSSLVALMLLGAFPEPLFLHISWGFSGSGPKSLAGTCSPLLDSCTSCMHLIRKQVFFTQPRHTWGLSPVYHLPFTLNSFSLSHEIFQRPAWILLSPSSFLWSPNSKMKLLSSSSVLCTNLW